MIVMFLIFVDYEDIFAVRKLLLRAELTSRMKF